MVSPPTIQCSLLCLFKSFDDSRNVQNERDPDEDRFGNTMPWAVFSNSHTKTGWSKLWQFWCEYSHTWVNGSKLAISSSYFLSLALSLRPGRSRIPLYYSNKVEHIDYWSVWGTQRGRLCNPLRRKYGWERHENEE